MIITHDQIDEFTNKSEIEDTTMKITFDQLAKLIPTNTEIEDWLLVLNDVLLEYEIDTAVRCAAFISQCAHESCNFTKLHENLNYRATSLVSTWPKLFNTANADIYAHKPELIANRAYANKIGNGPEESGDGWKYRGRGIIQITGKSNYTECSNFLYADNRLLNNPELLEQDKNTAVRSACWYWTTRKLNSFADAQDTKGLTKKINGGYLGLAERQQRFNEALSILGG